MPPMTVLWVVVVKQSLVGRGWQRKIGIRATLKLHISPCVANVALVYKIRKTLSSRESWPYFLYLFSGVRLRQQMTWQQLAAFWT